MSIEDAARITEEIVRRREEVARRDPRLPIIAQMAAVIFTEMLVFKPDDRHARRAAVDQAFLLYGEIAIRLAENDR